VEERILREAVAAVDDMPEHRRRHHGYVLWNEGWHEGVIGIVASRLVERFHRPVVLITRSHDSWKGSGRSIASFDLHGALAACSANLERFGGHRAAAGISIDETRIEAFAEDFARHADAHLDLGDLFEVVAVDAVVSARDLTLELAEELARLAPFGLGNPEPTLLVPATEAVAPATVGDGKHLRFRVRQHGRDAGSAIAFGQGTQIDRLRSAGRFDVAFRLKENHWNGTVAPQLVVRRVFDTPEGYEELRAALADLWRRGESAWTPEARRIFDELALHDESARRRQLLESESFRELLLDPALPRAA
jgi:single-stranded-DNA-specific exonuclease